MKHAKIHGVEEIFHIDLIKKFILVGLFHDFFLEEWKLIGAERSFEFQSDNPQYHALGFVDKIGLSHDGKSMLIVDYKSSKRKFTDESMKFNIQSLIYALAGFKEYPDLERIKCRFVFLQFVKQPFVEVEYTRNMVAGLELYLEWVSQKMMMFDEQDATGNMLANERIFFDGKWVEGSYLCGVNEEWEVDKNGHPKFICAYKNPFTIYLYVDEKGHIKKDRKAPEAGIPYTTEEYLGCPKYYAHNYQR